MKGKRVHGAFKNVTLDDPETLAIVDFMDRQGIPDGYLAANYDTIKQALHAAKKQRKRGILGRLFDARGFAVLRLFRLNGNEASSPAIEQAALACQNDEQVEALYQFLHEQSGISYRAELVCDDDSPF